MSDIFDTRFDGKAVQLSENLVGLGDDINLMQKDPTLTSLYIGMGWDLAGFDTEAIDLDVSLFLLNKDNMTRVDEDFIFYNQMDALNGGVQYHGDSRTGAGQGDDEMITVNLHSVPLDVLRIAITLSIYKGSEKSQDLGMVRNSYVRLLNQETNMELLRFELKDLMKDRIEYAMICGYINREGPKWHFQPTAEFFNGGLAEIATMYGMTIVNQ